MSRYGEKCRIKLCQFKHMTCSYSSVEGKSKEMFDNINDKEKETDDEYSKYNNMDEYDQFDVYQEISMNICWSGDHKCMEHDEDNLLLGVNVEQLRDDYDNGRQERFLCEKCDYISKEMEDVNKHFMANHKKSYSCWECQKEMGSISEFKKHYGSYHYTTEDY